MIIIGTYFHILLLLRKYVSLHAVQYFRSQKIKKRTYCENKKKHLWFLHLINILMSNIDKRAISINFRMYYCKLRIAYYFKLSIYKMKHHSFCFCGTLSKEFAHSCQRTNVLIRRFPNKKSFLMFIYSN